MPSPGPIDPVAALLAQHRAQDAAEARASKTDKLAGDLMNGAFGGMGGFAKIAFSGRAKTEQLALVILGLGASLGKHFTSAVMLGVHLSKNQPSAPPGYHGP